MEGWTDAYAHIHMSESLARDFLKRLGFDAAWKGTLEESLAFMDTNGIGKTMIVPRIPASEIYAERLEAASGNVVPVKLAALPSLAGLRCAISEPSRFATVEISAEVERDSRAECEREMLARQHEREQFQRELGWIG